MLEINLKSQCSGCGLCSTVCPANCLDMKTDREGFRYPSCDTEKCIRCGICVKTCSEVINKHILSAMKRGFSTVVQTAFDEGLPSYCADCGACVKECPTGALDWKIKK